jgi:hypothetical protein
MYYLVNHNVLRFNIAVNDALGVQLIDCLTDLLDDRGDFRLGHGF